MIFSRRRGGDTRNPAGQADASAEDALSGDDSAVEETPAAASDDGDPGSESGTAVVVPTAGLDPRSGPFDVTVGPTMERYLDLGSLRIPMIDGIEVRVQADPSGRVQQVALMAGENVLQVMVLAAPKTESIWDEVREGIRTQLRSDGFASQEVSGAYGPELRTRVRTPDGPADLRFIGISGPRWMVRAILQGPVAVDEQRAPVLLTCLRGMVIDRGHEAMPAGDPLPMHLPKEIADQAIGQQPDEPDAAAVADRRAARARQRRQNARKR